MLYLDLNVLVDQDDGLFGFVCPSMQLVAVPIYVPIVYWEPDLVLPVLFEDAEVQYQGVYVEPLHAAILLVAYCAFFYRQGHVVVQQYVVLFVVVA